MKALTVNKNTNQITMSIMDNSDWEDEWVGMPEFIQEDLTSHRKIIVHFRDDEDVQKFAELIGQRITPKLPSVWYPKMPPRKRLHLSYEDES